MRMLTTFCGFSVLLLFRGWVLSLLWGWFMVPLFHLPPILLFEALGVYLLVRLFCPHNSEQKDQKEVKDITFKYIWKVFVHEGSYITFFLALGWIIHLLL